MHTLMEPGDQGYFLTDIGRLIHKLFERKVTRLGYTRSQWQALAYLSNNPGLTQVALAHMMELEPITLSRHLDRMEKDGLLERRSDPKDRRVKRLHLTGKATPHLHEIQKIRDDIIELILTGIPDDHRTLFRNILIDIRKNLVDEESRS